MTLVVQDEQGVHRLRGHEIEEVAAWRPWSAPAYLDEADKTVPIRFWRDRRDYWRWVFKINCLDAAAALVLQGATTIYLDYWSWEKDLRNVKQ